MALLIEEAKTR